MEAARKAKNVSFALADAEVITFDKVEKEHRRNVWYSVSPSFIACTDQCKGFNLFGCELTLSILLPSIETRPDGNEQGDEAYHTTVECE